MNPLDIDPVIFHLGPLQVRWYGLMYVLGYLIGGKLISKLMKDGYLQVKREKLDSFITYLMVGMFLGARIFYVFVYNWDYYSHHLTEFFAVWKGGLSFHGAMIGMIGACIFFAKRNKVPVMSVVDTMALAACPGLMLGRIGNFINGELYGRVTDVSWGIVFAEGGPYARHPSQLYESFFEGFILGLILWSLYSARKLKVYGTASSLFLMGYSFFRFFIEYFREADIQLGYYFGNALSMGQILSVLMFLAGCLLFMITWKKNQKVSKDYINYSVKAAVKSS